MSDDEDDYDSQYPPEYLRPQSNPYGLEAGIGCLVLVIIGVLSILWLADYLMSG